MFKELYRLFQPDRATVPAAEAAAEPPVETRAAKPRNQQIEDDYVARLNALMNEAEEARSTGILVDVLTWTLARIAVRTGDQSAIGDILHQLGGQLAKVNEWSKAQAQARKELEVGAAIH